MASKRRIRRKMCQGKKRHKDMHGALIAIRLSGHKGMMPYKCKFCGFFHVGHPPAKIRHAIQNKQLFHKFGDIAN